MPVFMNVLLETKDKENIQIYASDSELSFSAHFSGKVKRKELLLLKEKGFLKLLGSFLLILLI